MRNFIDSVTWYLVIAIFNIGAVLKNHWRHILSALLLTIGFALAYYLTTGCTQPQIDTTAAAGGAAANTVIPGSGPLVQYAITAIAGMIFGGTATHVHHKRKKAKEAKAQTV